MRRKPLSIAVVAPAVMPLHGHGHRERSVHDLVRHVAARGVDVTLVVPRPGAVMHESGGDPFASPHIRLRHVPYTFPVRRRHHAAGLDRSTAFLWYGWLAGRMALSLSRQGEVQVIHSHGASALGSAVRHRGAPLVLNPHDLEEFGGTDGASRSGTRLGHAPLRAAIRRVARSAECVIATRASLQPFVQRFLSTPPERIRTIANGIDLVATSALAGPAEGLLMRQRHHIASGEIVLLTVGALQEGVDFRPVTSALARASRPGCTLAAAGWRWVVVGAGPLRGDLERDVEQHGIASHVIFAGRATDRDLHAWYEAASALVHPRRDPGGSSVLLEAMAHRKPIIAARAEDVEAQVHAGVNGWLVAPDDAGDLAAAIDASVRQASLLPQMGARSREIVERTFSWPVLAEQQIAIYDELLRNR